LLSPDKKKEKLANINTKITDFDNAITAKLFDTEIQEAKALIASMKAEKKDITLLQQALQKFYTLRDKRLKILRRIKKEAEELKRLIETDDLWREAEELKHKDAVLFFQITEEKYFRVAAGEVINIVATEKAKRTATPTPGTSTSSTSTSPTTTTATPSTTKTSPTHEWFSTTWVLSDNEKKVLAAADIHQDSYMNIITELQKSPDVPYGFDIKKHPKEAAFFRAKLEDGSAKWAIVWDVLYIQNLRPIDGKWLSKPVSSQSFIDSIHAQHQKAGPGASMRISHRNQKERTWSFVERKNKWTTPVAAPATAPATTPASTPASTPVAAPIAIVQSTEAVNIAKNSAAFTALPIEVQNALTNLAMSVEVKLGKREATLLDAVLKKNLDAYNYAKKNNSFTFVGIKNNDDTRHGKKPDGSGMIS